MKTPTPQTSAEVNCTSLKYMERSGAELQEEIIRFLKENGGRMEQDKICELLNITPYDIPWGYNIGWSRCIQSNQKYHLILSGFYSKYE
jgi:hypothetical protein